MPAPLTPRRRQARDLPWDHDRRATRIAPHIAAAGQGAIILTGATAGLGGNGGFAAFASAKFARRGLAQSLAREYGPSGIHVARVVL
jgi:NAD(P)-dependent dehydrogenase (short-subunit alcohol dehydrogenase family)